MVSTKFNSIFISLRFKLLAGVLGILTFVALFLGAFAYSQLIHQQNYLLDGQQERLAQNLNSSIRLVVDQVAATSQQLALMAQADEIDVGVEDYQRLLKQQWSDIQLYWDMRTVSLVESSGRLLAHAGLPLEVSDHQWLDKIGVVYEPQYRFDCDASCSLKVVVPTLLQGQMHLLFVETDLTEILARFRINEEFELAVLGPELASNQAPLDNAVQFWSRKLYSLSNRHNSIAILDSASKSWSWQTLNHGDGIYKIADETWALWVFPFQHVEPSPALLVMSNMDSWHALLYQFQQNMLGSLLFSLLLAGSLVTIMLWSPISRLVQLAKVLPLLAEHKFDLLRQTLPMQKQHSIDEVDLVSFATHKLADRLETLEGEVDSYTKELERLAMLDTLTGLPNKAMLVHELNKAVACVGRVHNQIAILFLDLDEFKRINDTLGHSEGDELLKVVSTRLNTSVRAMDTVFRLGGDEFIVLLRGMKSSQDVSKVIHKIFASLQQPVVLGRNKLIVTTSIGVVFCTSPNIPAEELIKQSELAMYQAKDGGRSNYRVFTEDMMLQANNRLMIEQDIGTAISDHQLALFLQPIVALPHGELKGFEALVRWFHPERGLIMPGDFIPDIEQSDAIIAVGNYVLEQSVILLKKLSEQGYQDIYVAVNLSAKHYLAPGLKQFIEGLLLRYDVSPECLLLEVTEESVMEQVERAMMVMKQLKELGVRIAIDDFGTGYSSLNYLKQLAFDVLKVDRCFTSGVLEGGVDTHIVTTVIDLAHNLGRTVVAEGVETLQQSQFLAKAGCELAQGYYYSKPLNQEKVFQLLEGIGQDNIWPRVDNVSPFIRKLGS
ncbi:putative bifunctional diguanylate cyclase/phosphodiesterase [Shewanella gelidii]|uniref:EAL domain-containing protein n=1 Tax=Shewanella gelidii TaxID=1642821 RepID=A0A917JQA9_9GAMM|nr:GGDEF domain-containing phosphodiesterase [Shewanella gelidii]MCL1097849.1 EAL domain-containing protein [Shewanella gelidii]GGI78281.1 hypothetical protein GCM10009332_14570 [Shewanella gelidii]